MTDAGLLMLYETRHDTGFELRGAAWHTARSLVKEGLGEIIGNGSGLPAMFWPNEEGMWIVRVEEEDEEPCPLCGNFRGHAHGM